MFFKLFNKCYVGHFSLDSIFNMIKTFQDYCKIFQKFVFSLIKTQLLSCKSFNISSIINQLFKTLWSFITHISAKIRKLKYLRHTSTFSPRNILVANSWWFCLAYLRYETGMIPAFQSAIFMKAGLVRSKWARGGLHHPPLLEF